MNAQQSCPSHAPFSPVEAVTQLLGDSICSLRKSPGPVEGGAKRRHVEFNLCRTCPRRRTDNCQTQCRVFGFSCFLLAPLFVLRYEGSLPKKPSHGLSEVGFATSSLIPARIVCKLSGQLKSLQPASNRTVSVKSTFSSCMYPQNKVRFETKHELSTHCVSYFYE